MVKVVFCYKNKLERQSKSSTDLGRKDEMGRWTEASSGGPEAQGGSPGNGKSGRILGDRAQKSTYMYQP